MDITKFHERSSMIKLILLLFGPHRMHDGERNIALDDADV